MSGMGHKSGTLYYFRENFTSIQTKKNKSHHCCEMLVEAMLMPENHSVAELWMMSFFSEARKITRELY